MSEKFLSVNSVAEFFDVSPATIWRWVRDRDFPKPVALTAGATRWKCDEVHAWAEARNTRLVTPTRAARAV